MHMSTGLPVECIAKHSTAEHSTNQVVVRELVRAAAEPEEVRQSARAQGGAVAVRHVVEPQRHAGDALGLEFVRTREVDVPQHLEAERPIRERRRRRIQHCYHCARTSTFT